MVKVKNRFFKGEENSEDINVSEVVALTSVPARNEQEEQVPTNSEPSPTKEDTAPTNVETSPTKEDTAPTNVETSPTKEETPTTNDEDETMAANAILASLKLEPKSKAKSYGFYLDDEVVIALDKLAKKNKTNRSKILNTLLRKVLLDK